MSKCSLDLLDSNHRTQSNLTVVYVSGAGISYGMLSRICPVDGFV